MNNAYRKSLLSLAVAAAMSSAISLPALAEEAPKDDAEVIQVTGYRGSLIQSRDIKRQASGSQDTIVAEDIAAFPDLNLADSLQRVPGVTITREGGEGRQISLRGLGSGFTRVKVNGMEGLGTSSSAMDSRGAVGNSRGFDFNIFASELFNQIDVKKSFSASQEEGGIGGTVNLRTAKPFDYDGLTAVVSGQVGTNSVTEEFDPRVAVLVSNTWDKFGALFSYARSNRHTDESGYNTYRWRARSSNPGPMVSEADAALLEAGEIWMPRGSRYSSWTNEQTREGITLAMQYRPTENLSFTFDALIGELRNEREEFHLAWGSNPYSVTVDSLEWEQVNEDKQMTQMNLSGMTMRTETRQDLSISEFTNYVLSSDWQISDNLSAKALLGYATAELKEPRSDKVYFETTEQVEVGVDCTGDSFYCQNSYSYNVADAANYRVRELDFRENYRKNDFLNFQLDFAWTLNDESSLEFGLNRKEYENEFREGRCDNYVRSGDDSDPYCASSVNRENRDLQDSFWYVRTDNPDADWVAANVRDVQAYYGLEDFKMTSIAPLVDRTVEETTTALYLQYVFNYEVADYVYLRGDVGVRYFETDIDTVLKESDGSNPTPYSSSYDDILPALNLAVEFDDGLIWRFSAAKNITRPSAGAINSPVRVQNDASADLRVGLSNPGIQPFESRDYETSLEYYFENDAGYAAIAYYRKDIENFHVGETLEIPFGETGLSLDLLGDGQTADTIYQVSRPINGEKSEFDGWEATIERDFDFLPDFWSGFGVRANYTKADGTSLYTNVQNSGQDLEKDFPGLSPTSYSGTLYYETDVWGARISGVFREQYISRVEAGLSDEDERGFHDSTFWDFASHYNVTDELKLTFKANNLTNEREEQYSDSNDRVYNTTKSGRNFYLGATYKF